VAECSDQAHSSHSILAGASLLLPALRVTRCKLADVIALFVTLDVRPALRERLLAAITTQGAASLEREPGCVQFDICVDNADPNRVLLYEIYEDEAAFDAHGKTPHFAVWRAAADECVERLERTVTSIVASPTTHD
jgi:(4S)-4-hydroxy-5-phosphonooxypentane-2,3-dione isomerase